MSEYKLMKVIWKQFKIVWEILNFE
jgi:hypothetical protein